MEITLRNGLPTKKTLETLIEEYDRRFKLYTSQLYGKGSNCLIWQDKYTQERIQQFIDYAAEMGINFGKFQPYESPTVGHLYINPSVKVVEESKRVTKEFKGVLENCVFCGEPTRFWYRKANKPCCQSCAKTHGPEDFIKLKPAE